MKIWIGFMAIVVLMVVAPLNPVFSGMLQDDYKIMEVRRMNLEKTRMEYGNKLKALSMRQNYMTQALYKCIAEKPRSSWGEKLDQAKEINQQLELTRTSMVKLRTELDAVRRDLEKSRTEIEKKHTFKGPGTDYETEFRAYMDKLEEQYFKRLEKELFQRYDEYFSGIEKYNEYLKNCSSICKQ